MYTNNKNEKIYYAGHVCAHHGTRRKIFTSLSTRYLLIRVYSLHLCADDTDEMKVIRISSDVSNIVLASLSTSSSSSESGVHNFDDSLK